MTSAGTMVPPPATAPAVAMRNDSESYEYCASVFPIVATAQLAPDTETVLAILAREDPSLTLQLLRIFVGNVGMYHRYLPAFPELVLSSQDRACLNDTAVAVVARVVGSGVLAGRDLEDAMLLAYTYGPDLRMFFGALDALPADTAPEDAVESLRTALLENTVLDMREVIVLGMLVRRWGPDAIMRLSQSLREAPFWALDCKLVLQERLRVAVAILPFATIGWQVCTLERRGHWLLERLRARSWPRDAYRETNDKPCFPGSSALTPPSADELACARNWRGTSLPIEDTPYMFLSLSLAG